MLHEARGNSGAKKAMAEKKVAREVCTTTSCTRSCMAEWLDDHLGCLRSWVGTLLEKALVVEADSENPVHCSLPQREFV